jgi:O-acetyl-ADP-ribose deacetylase (regulator of RNase III)
MSINFLLCSYSPTPANELADHFEVVCGSLPNVKVHRGSIFDTPVDIVVCPGNSFGFMDDGGLAAMYAKKWPSVPAKVRSMVLGKYHGEMLVGQADSVETDDPQFPYMILAPTMRVPMKLPSNTVNPYLALRGIGLLLTAYGGPAQFGYRTEVTVALPGFGTGVGGVDPLICARQFYKGLQEIVSPLDRRTAATWQDASAMHQKLYTNSVTDLTV